MSKKSRQDRADKFKAKRYPLYIDAVLAARCYCKSFGFGFWFWSVWEVTNLLPWPSVCGKRSPGNRRQVVISPSCLRVAFILSGNRHPWYDGVTVCQLGWSAQPGLGSGEPRGHWFIWTQCFRSCCVLIKRMLTSTCQNEDPLFWTGWSLREMVTIHSAC